jgi:hypothetical protein
MEGRRRPSHHAGESALTFSGCCGLLNQISPSAPFNPVRKGLLVPTELVSDAVHSCEALKPTCSISQERR